jgi:urea transport system permease protein
LFLRRCGFLAAVLVLLGALCGAPARAQSADEAFATAIAGLATTSFPDKSAAVAAISELRHPNGRAVLAALLDGKLYYRNADNRVFITDGGETALALTDPLTLAAGGTGTTDEFTRITTNNSLRKSLRSAVASFALSDPDADVRLAAVREMLRSMDEDSVALLRESLAKESDSDVKQAMREGLALADLDSPDADTRLKALQSLTESLSPDVYNRLTAMVTAAEDGSFPESDERVRTMAREVISSIDVSRAFYSTLETLFFG